MVDQQPESTPWHLPRSPPGPCERGYTAAEVDGVAYPDYAAEPDVDPTRDTETFASVEPAVDNWRWAGVPFRLRTGKALGAARRFVEIRFRPVPHLAFEQAAAPRQNTIRLELRPDRILVGLVVNGPGDPFDLEPAELCVEFSPQALPAYARLLLDVLRGDPTLAIRDDEAEESWRIVEPILAAWRAGSPTLRTYPAGSAGPDDSNPRPPSEGGEPS
jgi:glucose-6-phosphate 1-dehydrogenase